MGARPAIAAALLLAALPARAAEYAALQGHGGPVRAIALNGDGTALTASFDYSVGYWRDGAPTWLEGHRAAVNAVIWLGAGRAASGGDDFDVRIWDLATGDSTALPGHEGKVVALALAPDGGLLASASWDGTLGLWPLDGQGGAGPPRFLDGHQGAVNDVAFSADGARLFSAAADGTIREWDAATGAELRTVIAHGFGVNTLELGPGDAWLAYGAVDGGTRVIDPETGAEIGDFTLDRRPILAMAVPPAGDMLAVGDGEGYIMVLDTDDWSLARDFRAATRGPVWALAWAAAGDAIAAAGISDTAYLWPLDGLSGADAVLGAGERSFLRDPATMTNGERQFARKCSVCHTLTGDGARRAGPTLENLFGRPAGSVPGYSYSPALRDIGITWTDETIDALFDEGPDHYVPGTKMPMQRIAGAQDRADLIEYLRTATDPERSRP
ncbi:c-type cytochrome [Rhodobacteraceae bacterium 2CG4]|uniref:C-type cytochrome n=1 Tax=Halovulum marinum TaxID=2662447 RepID=A0A6L5Z0Q5_9RHOB|nr:c-type cytochrome [Halovulum marinum]MSU90146.1 c-type cytochrome [Halovulum marinum]